MHNPRGDSMRQRLTPHPGRLHTGTFIKINSVHVVEVLGGTPMQFAVVDAEHAAFDRRDIDLMVLAARAVDLPLLVRVPDMSAPAVQGALDLGAAGLLVPHVDSAAQARELVARSRCRTGVRGFSNATRAAGQGALPMAQALAATEDVFLLAQIESVAAVEAVADIAAVDGIDGLFVGRADLALSFGETDTRSAPVLAATRRVLDVALAAGKIAGMAVGTRSERDEFAAWGANWFVVGSDQSLLRQAASAAAQDARALRMPD
jgi:2-keto-3-deoxy-L-rhamnonate aldolase RhmA